MKETSKQFVVMCLLFSLFLKNITKTEVSKQIYLYFTYKQSFWGTPRCWNGKAHTQSKHTPYKQALRSQQGQQCKPVVILV